MLEEKNFYDLLEDFECAAQMVMKTNPETNGELVKELAEIAMLKAEKFGNYAKQYWSKRENEE